MATPHPLHSPVPFPRRNRFIRLLAGLALLAVPFFTQAANFTLAVVPQAAPTETYRRWAPFTEQLQHVIGQQLQLRVYRSFDEFESDLLKGRVDFAYMNPYHFLMARKAQGYLPLVRDGSRLLSGQLLVRRDSPLQSVKQLNGKVIGFPDPNAFAASLYMRALLQEKVGIRFTANYLGTHGNVYRHVILGDMAAGAGVNMTFARERPETRNELRVLYETPGTASHPLCVHPRVPAVLREAVTQAIMEMGKNENGRAMLEQIDMVQPVRAVYARDYQPLEKLDLQKLAVRPGHTLQ
jgi:phosphonate transport system substrate-binding protein